MALKSDGIKKLKNDVEVILGILSPIPDDIEDIIDGENERTQYLEEHGRSSVDDISEGLEEINENLKRISDLREKLENILDNLYDLC